MCGSGAEKKSQTKRGFARPDLLIGYDEGEEDDGDVLDQGTRLRRSLKATRLLERRVLRKELALDGR